LKGDSTFRHLSYQEAKTRIESFDEDVKDQLEYDETRASEELALEIDDIPCYLYPPVVTSKPTSISEEQLMTMTSTTIIFNVRTYLIKTDKGF
jgi:hypothetical protein